MTFRSYSLIALAGAAALFIGGCQTDVAGNAKALRPIPPKTLALMSEKGMTRRDPVLVRIYKEENELEIWKKNASGRYAHLKTYEICRWSGTLGPKKQEGDGQAPEGFYAVGPGQLQPNSSYYLAFNLGYPNAFDKSLGRTGSHLMVHGDCLSKGCYAMTDEQIAEVYAIVREALQAGQPSFQVQAFPFRMTAENMARRRDDRNFAFWQNLKQGADHFELTKLEPKVDVCGQKYVFDAEPKYGRFDPYAQCPDYEVNPAIAMALAGKKKQDDEQFAQLVAGGLQTAEAYVPQNGRQRRSLDEPLKPAPAPVMTAAAEPQTTGSLALAMVETKGAVPMPVPSPYASAQGKQKSGMFAWLRGDKPEDLDAPATPASESAGTPESKSGAVTVATRDSRRPAAQQPVAASFAPSQDEKAPFYKRWLGFGKKDEGESDKAEKPAPRPAPQSAAAPLPAPKPAAVAPAPQPPAAAESSQPALPPITPDQMGGPGILPSGSFR